MNGDYIIKGQQINGDYIAYAQINISCGLKSTSELGGILQGLRGAYNMPLELGPSQSGHPRFSQTLIGQKATGDVTVDPWYTSATQSVLHLRLMIDVLNTMMENPTLSSSATLPETLASLQRILKLTELALQTYQHTPLIRTLSRAICIRVENCRQLLRELISNLSNYRHILSATALYFVRRYAGGILGGTDAIAVLDSKIRDRHGSLAGCLVALGWQVTARYALTGIILTQSAA